MTSAVQPITMILLISSVLTDIPEKKCVFVDYFRNTPSIANSKCATHQVCKERPFNISYIHIPPYYYDKMTTQSEQPLEFILQTCCGKCVKYNKVQVFKNITDLTQHKMETSDFIYPIFADSNTRTVYGYHYMPFLNVPSVMLVTAKEGVDITGFFLKVFPITLICILASVISGFVCWCLEKRKNGDEFPKHFFGGWFEGFWWSFITMTTVGYGDKSPRTFLGRVFSTIWISVGMICNGLLTAIVISEIMKMNSPPPPNMKGKTIGSLLYRDYEAMIVAQNGGELYPQAIPSAQPVDIFEDALVMINNLRQQKLDGFVIDQPTLWYIHSMADNLMAIDSQYNLITTEDVKESVSFLISKTTSTTIHYQGTDQLTYGILVRHKHHYDFFVDMVTNNRWRGRGQLEAWWNHYAAKAKFATMGNFTVGSHPNARKMDLYKEDSNILFSYESKLFRRAIIVFGCLLLGIGVLGLVANMKRYQGNLRYMCTRHE